MKLRSGRKVESQTLAEIEKDPRAVRTIHRKDARGPQVKRSHSLSNLNVAESESNNNNKSQQQRNASKRLKTESKTKTKSIDIKNFDLGNASNAAMNQIDSTINAIKHNDIDAAREEMKKLLNVKSTNDLFEQFQTFIKKSSSNSHDNKSNDNNESDSASSSESESDEMDEDDDIYEMGSKSNKRKNKHKSKTKTNKKSKKRNVSKKRKQKGPRKYNKWSKSEVDAFRKVMGNIADTGKVGDSPVTGGTFTQDQWFIIQGLFKSEIASNKTLDQIQSKWRNVTCSSGKTKSPTKHKLFSPIYEEIKKKRAEDETSQGLVHLFDFCFFIVYNVVFVCLCSQ